MSAPQVTVDSLTVTIRGKAILKAVSFAASNEVLGVAGPNGAGKSTLLRSIEAATRKSQPAVALEPTGGRKGPTVGYLPQKFSLPKELSVREFVEYAAWIKNVPDGKDRAEEAIRATQLADLSARRLGRVSGGEAQRAGFASVLVESPDVLLLDEPTTGVDIHQRDIMRGIIANQSAGRLTLISSHITEDLEELCDRVLVLSHGRVRFIGTIAEAQEATGAATFAQALLQLSGGAP